MPIVAIHGVNVRDPNWCDNSGITSSLQQYVAPAIRKSETCRIIPVYWGDLGATFAWNRRSLPGDEMRKALLTSFMSFNAALPARASAGGVHPIDPVNAVLTEPGSVQTSKIFDAIQFETLAPSQKAQTKKPVGKITELALMARFETALAARSTDLGADPTYGTSLIALRNAVHHLYDPARTTQTFSYDDVEALAQKSLGGTIIDWLIGIGNDVIAAIERSHHGDPAETARSFVQYREPLNDLVTTFFGDVFKYLGNHGSPAVPGDITKRFLAALQIAAQETATTGEPTIILSHSQGGQIVYDALSSIVGKPGPYENIKVQLWCAAACQVGLFEEMKLFWKNDPTGAASNTKTESPSPSVLGTWVACWDPTDVLSYTAAPIFDRVLDVAFQSGWIPPLSHMGYLSLSEFYKRLHNVILNPTVDGWNQTVT